MQLQKTILSAQNYMMYNMFILRIVAGFLFKKNHEYFRNQAFYSKE